MSLERRTGSIPVPGTKERSEHAQLMFNKLEINEGMLVENIVAQMLCAKGHRLFFYSSSSEVAEDRMEIDVLIQREKVTSRHNISAIEVKSGNK